MLRCRRSGSAATCPGPRRSPVGLQADSADDVQSIVMIGDSITEGSIDELHDRFAAAGYDDVLIEAQRGKRMAISTATTRAASGSPISSPAATTITTGELWVVALGTNDINQYGSPDELAGVVNEMLDAVPDDVPLVWVDTYYRDQSRRARRSSTPSSPTGSSRRGNAVMARWSDVAAGDGVLSGDGVHPTDDGQLVFADVVGSEVDDFLDR